MEFLFCILCLGIFAPKGSESKYPDVAENIEKAMKGEEKQGSNVRGSNVTAPPICHVQKMKFNSPECQLFSVPQFEYCLNQKKVENFIGWCLPNGRFHRCPQESYDKLKSLVNIEITKCTEFPAYLAIPEYENCVFKTEVVEAWPNVSCTGPRCLVEPSYIGKIPSPHCTRELHEKLKALVNIDFEACSSLLPDADFLKIPKVKDCLGSQSMGSWTAFCILLKKPANCPQESHDQLQELLNFDLPACKDQDQTPRTEQSDRLKPKPSVVGSRRICRD